jgi:hypothetical protein
MTPNSTDDSAGPTDSAWDVRDGDKNQTSAYTGLTTRV